MNKKLLAKIDYFHKLAMESYSSPILPEYQEALNKMLFLDGKPTELEVDGKCGPKTKEAIQAFKKKYHVEYMTDEAAAKYAFYTAKDERHF